MQANVKTQRGILLAFALLALLLITTTARWTNSSRLLAHSNENLLRLHVIANSDSVADQDVKLVVRDALVPILQQATEEAGDADQAEIAITAAEESIRTMAETVLADQGFSYSAAVEIGPYYFDERTSGDMTLPEGVYRTVRVILGEGKGHNWWCVLFPPLCFSQLEEGGVAVATGTSATTGKNPSIKLSWRFLDRLWPKAQAKADLPLQ